MILENWSKTLLISYRLLGLVVDRLDSMVRQVSLNSMYYNRKAGCNTMSQIEKLIEYNDKKANLTNLKVIIEQCMSNLPQKELEVVSLIYLDGLNVDDVADTLEISVRTVFRRKKRAIESFAKALSRICSYDYLMDNYSDEVWLMDIYESQRSRDNDKIDVERKEAVNIIFRALKELKATV